MKKNNILKRALFVSLVIIFIVTLSTNIVLAVAVTEENLKEAFQKFIASSDNEKNYQATVGNNQITITVDQTSYVFSYDLTDKPTFTYEAQIVQGMDYEEYKEKTESSSAVMLGYVAIASLQGVEYKDSLTYYAMMLLGTALTNAFSTNNTNGYYRIIDDTQTTEGITIEKDPNSTNTIYVSEFGNHVMEYINSLYGNGKTVNDKDALNTFEMTTVLEDVTDTSCKLVSTVVVNTDADFSQLNGYAKKVEDSLNNKEQQNSNNNDAQSVTTTNEESTNTVVDNSTTNAEGSSNTTATQKTNAENATNNIRAKVEEEDRMLEELKDKLKNTTRQLDNTPKTGAETNYVLIVVCVLGIISAIAIVIIKLKLN
ncbi:MAG: hypothetical protein IKP28_04250 [Clostridia bacterium]|nr:hypothetical protein [Clostridia bacterium]